LSFQIISRPETDSAVSTTELSARGIFSKYGPPLMPAISSSRFCESIVMLETAEAISEKPEVRKELQRASFFVSMR
jgi:hypothetical protein